MSERDSENEFGNDFEHDFENDSGNDSELIFGRPPDQYVESLGQSFREVGQWCVLAPPRRGVSAADVIYNSAR